MSSRSNEMYSREFQAMLDSLVEGDSLLEESFHNNVTEKKRRLTMHQVKSLEKNFEVENKLEPERKAKIAKELGLQPRQVAIWFQNRRARWKTKQLEIDYGVLKANYDALKLDYTNLEQERQVLTAKLRDLRGKVKEENAESKDEENTQTRVTFPSSSSCAHFRGSSSSSSHSWVEPCRLEPQIVKMEEQNDIFTAEETCNFFSIDHAPTLQWWFNGV